MHFKAVVAGRSQLYRSMDNYTGEPYNPSPGQTTSTPLPENLWGESGDLLA